MGTLRIDYHHDIVADYNYVRTSDGNDDTHPGSQVLLPQSNCFIHQWRKYIHSGRVRL